MLTLFLTADLSMNLWGTSCWWPSRRLSRTLGPKPSICSSSSWNAWRRRNWYVNSVPPERQSPLHIPLVLRNIFLNHSPTVLHFQPSSQRSSGSIGSCSLLPSVAKTLLSVPGFNEVCTAGLPHPSEAHPSASDCLHQMSWGEKIGFLLENASLQGFPFVWELGIADGLIVKYLSDTGLLC